MKIYKLYKTGILLAGICLYKTASAQLYISNVAFATEQNSLVFVNGDVTYAGTAQQTVGHQGLLELKGNWNNIASADKKVFTDASSGTVLMSGALQTFTGANTRFPNLTIAGTNKKQQFTTIEIRDTLDLTDRELDVNGNTATVLSNDVNAVKYDGEGYVNTSTVNTGWLVRNMNSGADYVLPLGNMNGSTFRYRPLVLKAEQAGNVYGQFQHYNPARDGYPASVKANNISKVNDYWYHGIKTDATEGNSVNIQLPYSSVTDGQFSTMVKWDDVKHDWEKLESAGPRLSNLYNTDDYIFNTMSPVAINKNSVTPVHLGNEDENTFFIPNVITPNGDGRNDRFVINPPDPSSVMEIVIFNRWNNVVYQNKRYDNSWEGKGLDGGTYFYVVKITTHDAKTTEYKGYVMLMR